MCLNFNTLAQLHKSTVYHKNMITESFSEETNEKKKHHSNI